MSGVAREPTAPSQAIDDVEVAGLTKARMLDKTVESRLGRKLSTCDTPIGSSPRELKKRYGVELNMEVVCQPKTASPGRS